MSATPDAASELAALRAERDRARRWKARAEAAEAKLRQVVEIAFGVGVQAAMQGIRAVLRDSGDRPAEPAAACSCDRVYDPPGMPHRMWCDTQALPHLFRSGSGLHACGAPGGDGGYCGRPADDPVHRPAEVSVPSTQRGEGGNSEETHHGGFGCAMPSTTARSPYCPCPRFAEPDRSTE